MAKYTTKDIYVMDEIEHIRTSTGMYIGSTENPTRLLEEILDNALDEVQAGYCDIIGVMIDTKKGIFSVLDYGRGLPFDQSLPIDQDPPIMTSTKLFSSGKFRKDKSDSVYKISVGLHGCGMVVVNALSEWMNIAIYRDGLYGYYTFKDASIIERTQNKYSEKKQFSTKITVKPSKKFFSSININIDVIEERIKIACVNFKNLKSVIRIDDKDLIIKDVTEKDLISSYITKTEGLDWIEINIKKDQEECQVKLAWDIESPISYKIFSCVNLTRVHSGVHINNLLNIIKDVFIQLGKKYKYNFDIADCLSFLRCYINLKIIKTSFEAQVKVKLESKSDLSIMNPLEDMIKKYLENNKELLIHLLERFQSYRQDISIKKINKISHRRLSSKFTNLRDCKDPGGELLIGEGESAVGGLIHVRDPKKHAILPLRGVVSNVLTKSNPLGNNIVKGIIEAIGTGIYPYCDISKLRYSKIILSADADPAGMFITTLLIMIFAKLVPDIIKYEKLYICETPLFAIRKNDKLIPLWTKEDLENARSNGEYIKRFKGLGEFSPKDLKIFTLDENTRKLIKIIWSDNHEKLFDLMSNSNERRKLILGEWSLNN